MDTANLTRFKKLFEEQRETILKSHRVVDEDLQLKADDLMDEVDLTSSEMETSMRMRLRNRETLLIKKIDESLRRIQDGTFGGCESCGEDIELRRLEARPTATLCLGCKEEEERHEEVHIDGHRSKSMGVKLRIATAV